MKTSVIITNYNQSKFIEQTIQSVYTQSLLPDELIIVDDASTDDSLGKVEKLVKELPKSIKTKIVKHISNAGVAHARNTGVGNSTGDIIAFLDGDDAYYPDKLKHSIKILKEHPPVGLVFSDFNILNENTKEIKREFKHPYSFNLLRQFCIVSTNSIIRRDILMRAGPFNQDFAPCEDYDMYLRISQLSLMWHIPEALFLYREHENSATIKGREHALSQLQKMRKHWNLV